MENARKDYFGPKLEKLKKEVAELDLFKVVKSAPCLDIILNDTCDDMVVLMNKGSEDTLTFDKPVIEHFLVKVPDLIIFVCSNIVNASSCHNHPPIP